MREQAIAAQLPAKPLELYGSDLYGDALKAASRNLEEAGLSECVRTEAGQRAGNLCARGARHTGGEPALRRAHGRTGRTGRALSETGRCAEKEIRRLDGLPVHRRQGHPEADAPVSVQNAPRCSTARSNAVCWNTRSCPGAIGPRLSSSMQSSARGLQVIFMFSVPLIRFRSVVSLLSSLMRRRRSLTESAFFSASS